MLDRKKSREGFYGLVRFLALSLSVCAGSRLGCERHGSPPRLERFVRPSPQVCEGVSRAMLLGKVVKHEECKSLGGCLLLFSVAIVTVDPVIKYCSGISGALWSVHQSGLLCCKLIQKKKKTPGCPRNTETLQKKKKILVSVTCKTGMLCLFISFLSDLRECWSSQLCVIDTKDGRSNIRRPAALRTPNTFARKYRKHRVP